MRKVMVVLSLIAFLGITLGATLAYAQTGEERCKTLIERAQAKLALVQDRDQRMKAEGWLLKAKGSHNLANYWDCEQEAGKALDIAGGM